MKNFLRRAVTGCLVPRACIAPAARRLLRAAGWLLVASAGWAAATPAAADDRPNVVVFLADDMGYADAGFTGATDIRTPNLDALAASGVVFSRGYANHPFCGPSRAALLSGRYQNRFGFETNPALDRANPYMGIDVKEYLFPARMQAAGYRTGAVGKWHLGAAAPFHPNRRGFDYFYGFLGGGHDYFRIDQTQPLREGYLHGLERNGQPAGFDGYLTTALSRDAAAFVTRNRDEPFFLYVAYNAPHAPLQAPKEIIAEYGSIQDPKRRVYAAMVDAMDRGIGEVLTALDTHGLRENTLVVFMSDNGGPEARPGSPGRWNGSSNAPFRGGKGNLYDGGVHVPFVASWPARLPAGAVYDAPVIMLDVARTAVELAGGDADAEPALEGVNLIPHVTGEVTTPPHAALFWKNAHGKQWSILTPDGVKHLRDRSAAGPELFRLNQDVGESHDLSEAEPALAAELRERWVAWDAQNVPSRLDNYKTYHAQRDRFFLESLPRAAVEAGYAPEPVPTFKKK